jgi:hypothetical protein
MVQVQQTLVLRVFDLPEHRPLIQAQHVGAPSTTPLAANAAQIFAPRRVVRNEDTLENQQLPMKPFSAGRPIDDIVMMRKIAA